MIDVLKSLTFNINLYISDIHLPLDDLDNVDEDDYEMIRDDLETIREELMSRVTASSAANKNSLTSKCVRVMYHLTCILLEDYFFSGHSFNNCSGNYLLILIN